MASLVFERLETIYAPQAWAFEHPPWHSKVERSNVAFKRLETYLMQNRSWRLNVHPWRLNVKRLNLPFERPWQHSNVEHSNVHSWHSIVQNFFLVRTWSLLVQAIQP